MIPEHRRVYYRDDRGVLRLVLAWDHVAGHGLVPVIAVGSGPAYPVHPDDLGRDWFVEDGPELTDHESRCAALSH